MIKAENEKFPLCPVCLETLTTNLYFGCDGYLYLKNCFTELSFKSPIFRQDFSYYLPVNKVVIGKVYFEKKVRFIFKVLFDDLDGFNQERFNRKGFDRNGFDINGIDENGFIRIKN